MESITYPQCRIVPIRMLQADNAEKFLDGLSCIPGIRRILVHGPGYQNNAEKPEDTYTPRIPSSTVVKIAEQNINMHILIGDIIIEALDDTVMDKIAIFCEDFFDDLSFQILIGKFIKDKQSLSDYLSKDPEFDPFFVGLSDYKPQITPSLINPVCPT